MSIFNSENWYSDALFQYEKCTGISAATAKSLKKISVKHGLDKVTSCLSIGPGPGYVDVPLIKDCMPGLKVYYGVDPRAESLADLKDCLAGTVESDVQVNLIPEYIEKWEGPPEEFKFDLILAVQVLYYIQDKQKLFKQLMEWLNPGGLLVIVHCADSLMCGIGAELGLQADNYLYLTDQVARDLEEAGIQFWTEEPVFGHLDVLDPDPALIEFFLHRRVQGTEVDEIKKIIKKLVPSGFLNESEKTIIFMASA